MLTHKQTYYKVNNQHVIHMMRHNVEVDVNCFVSTVIVQHSFTRYLFIEYGATGYTNSSLDITHSYIRHCICIYN